MKLLSQKITTIGAVLLLAVIQLSCKARKKPEELLFQALGPEQTGLNVRNDLHYDQAFNLFKYIYFYNGSGVGAADFNGDGLIDLFFGGNQTDDRFFLNRSGLKFEDMTAAAGIPADGGWTTGVSVVDINQDGRMDIYVCRVGNYETLHSKNLLLINQGVDEKGVPKFKDEASAYGLDFSGFSTQAAFFDYDLDGDVDMFLLNHSVHENGTFRPRKEFLGTVHPLAGDRFYRNEGGRFVDYSRESGINSNAIGYGLGVVVSDINCDGYPDLYVGNDFHENDYLYINQANGTFKESATEMLQHTSQYSMGVDAADINNDGRPEIISVDMLPEDPVILKRSLGEDAYDIFQHKISVGYSFQYTRNNLQWNRPDSNFSEIGLYSGVAATDWSWAPLWVDFNNDGLKDLFVSNGIPKRMNDIDYVNFVSNTEMRKSIDNNAVKEKDIRLIEKFPEIKLPNKFYLNQGELRFSDQSGAVLGDEPGFSNGAVYADLDNDGDLDIVVNNIDAPAILYENKHKPVAKSGIIQLELTGSEKNRQAIGARLLAFSKGQLTMAEKYPVHGFLSSMEIPLQLGIETQGPDSLWLVWPDQTFEKISLPDSSRYVAKLTLQWRPGLPELDSKQIRFKQEAGAGSNWFDDASSAGLAFTHRENHFVEFDREPLIPHMLSTEGPALAVADINGDGWEDVWIGGARNQSSAIFLQDGKGNFYHQPSAALQADSMLEDVDAVWADMNGDRYPDLIVASGGNEFYGRDWHNSPRLYLNDGKGNLTKQTDAFDSLYLTASSIAVSDVDGDGFNDVFIGARTVPWEYGQLPRSYFLRNDGNGRFKGFGIESWKAIEKTGMVTDANFADIDGNGQADLLLALEWGTITAWMHKGKSWERLDLGPEKGWWNFVLPVDIDGDGDKDIVAGNLGWNSRLQANSDHPVRMYYNDFDKNGKHEQIVSYYIGDRELPFANKSELERQLPLLKKKFLYAEDFAKAGMDDLFGKELLKDAVKWEANYFGHVVYINEQKAGFRMQPLPWQAQFSSLRTGAWVADRVTGQGNLILMGNYYDNNIQMGRYDADFGSSLQLDSTGNWQWNSLPGYWSPGQVRRMKLVRMPKGDAWVLARNNGPLGLLRQWR
jgi:hypothetical protein